MQTPTGPQMVLSVSKTYIRLKDLIVEKKFLQKETKKLKNLNCHLGSRLDEQEQRLSAVTIELNKTWNLVGRMQRQHRQLHTHEQVLRYQLQQKRRMLTEIKEELEYCRRKWALAKEKNNESQTQWESLRLEFSKRKESDLNVSGESGYSDSPVSEEDDDEKTVQKPRSSRLRKKLNLENFSLTTLEPKDRKVTRNQSVSPVGNARESVTRRNSDSHITQFATEVFQATTDVVQPIVHTVCAECGENCIKHSVHFETDTAERQKSTDQVKVSEPVIHDARHQPTNAQKLVEAKASTSKTKMSCELRKTGAITTSKQEESLEDMFMRLSGASEPQTHNGPSNDAKPTETNHIDESHCETETSSPIGSECYAVQEIETNKEEDVPPPTLTPEERERKRLDRIERLEGQCKELLKQVTRASTRGDELNKRIDDAHSRHTPVCETSSTTDEVDSIESEQPSTSGLEKTEIASKTDEECLSATEQEYLTRRDDRLKRLEAESQAYMNRVKSTNRRATDIDTKLEFLNGRYGSEDEAGTSVNTTNETHEKTSESSENGEQSCSLEVDENVGRSASVTTEPLHENSSKQENQIDDVNQSNDDANSENNQASD